MKVRKKVLKKKKKWKGFLTPAVIVFDILLLIFLVKVIFSDEKHTEISVDVPTVAVEKFSKQVNSTVVKNIGEPASGFTPGMYMSVFSGIKEVDFKGVEAKGGVYRYTIEDDVILERAGDTKKTSTDGVITKEGMNTLLSNIATRLEIDFSESGALEEVLKRIKGNRGGSIEIDNSVTARIGGSAFLYGVTITPLEVLEDSRCPVDVECVQAGTVKLRIEIQTGDEEEKEEQDISLNQNTRIGDHTITFADVFPAQKSESEIKPKEYEFVFQIEKDKTKEETNETAKSL